MRKSPAKRLSLWMRLMMFLIALGIVFRLANLDQKIFWVDEVATAIRVAGYTRAEVVQQVSDGQVLHPPDLLRYQQLRVAGRDRPWRDTWNALTQSPEHTPLYFLLTRLWSQVFGSSVAAIRSLSVVFGLLMLPALYALCWELFQSRLVGGLAVAWLSVSPFFVAYSQEARPYSLWALLLLVSGVTLLRALQQPTPTRWMQYAIALTLSLYTSVLTLPIGLGHGLYAIATDQEKSALRLRGFLFAAILAGLLFLPWMVVMVQQWSTLQENTTWARSPLNPLAMLAIWLYSFAVLAFDVPVAPLSSPLAIVQVVIAAIVLALMGWACWHLSRRTSPRVSGFVAAIALPTPLLLVLVDLLQGGQSAATSRYLIPTQIGLVLAVAALLGQHLGKLPETSSRKRWRVAAIALLSISIFSCFVNLERSPDYQKARNLANPAIATILNQQPTQTLWAEASQTLDLLSLSHLLEPTVTLRILPTEALIQAIAPDQAALLFTPSEALRQKIQENSSLQISLLYQPSLLTPDDIHLSLWQVKQVSSD